ncbi:hypothetical protein EIH79_26990 [Paenibacillus tundrae]|nr:hypothetical protein [Paenibacillus tundrae]
MELIIMSTISSYLPDIVDYAVSAGITVRSNTLRKEQTEFVCPWCTLSKGNYKLTLNRSRGVFRCFTCGINGGVIDFIQHVEQKSREEVLKNLREKSGLDEMLHQKKQAKKHPAERLNTSQLGLIGFRDSRTPRLRYGDYTYRKSLNEWIWAEWTRFIDCKKREALVHLIYSIQINQYQQALDDIDQMSKDIDYDLLPEVFEAYGCGNQPRTWAIGVHKWADSLQESYLKTIKNY